MHEIDDAVLQSGERIEAFPGQILLEILPYSFDWIDLGRVGRLKPQDHIVRNTQVLGGMTTRVVEEKHVERVRTRAGKLVEKDLDVVLIQLGKPRKKLSPHLGATLPYR